MSANYEELDFRPTDLGDLMLRRRRMPQFGETDIYEVKLGEYFLMTSFFFEAEHQLAKLGLAASSKPELDVVVGGLGLGYTAAAALEDPRVTELVVVEYLAPVIEWHQRGLVPLGEQLANEPRCRFQQSDFFALSREPDTHFDLQEPSKKHDVILLDIDHTPTNVLHQTNTRFYTEIGLTELRQKLNPGGIFALWADGKPEDEFTQKLGCVFAEAESHTIEFANPMTKGTSTGAVYVAKV